MCAAILLAGCAGQKGSSTTAGKPKTTPPVITADFRPVGSVVLVNAAAGFVVISFPAGPVPQAARRLAVYHKGLKTAEIKVTGPQEDNNTVADILSGHAQLQDEVHEE